MSSLQAERQVILLSAGTAARRRAMGERAERLLGEVDWSRLVETLRRRRLLTVLGPRVLELAEGSAGDGFPEAVEQALEAGRRRGAFLQLISLRIVAMLADAGIRCTPLKGPLLGEAIYGVGRQHRLWSYVERNPEVTSNARGQAVIAWANGEPIEVVLGNTHGANGGLHTVAPSSLLGVSDWGVIATMNPQGTATVFWVEEPKKEESILYAQAITPGAQPVKVVSSEPVPSVP